MKCAPLSRWILVSALINVTRSSIQYPSLGWGIIRGDAYDAPVTATGSHNPKGSATAQAATIGGYASLNEVLSARGGSTAMKDISFDGASEPPSASRVPCETSPSDRFTAISVLAIATSGSNNSHVAVDRTGCILVSDDETIQVWEGRDQPIDNQTTAALWRAHALLSDVVIVIIHLKHSAPLASSRVLLPTELQQALTAGFEHRVRAGLSRGQLVVIGMMEPYNSTSIEESDEKLWREHLVLDTLRFMPPDCLERFEVHLVTETDVLKYVPYDVLAIAARANGSYSVTDSSLFTSLIEQTFVSFGGRRDGTLFSAVRKLIIKDLHYRVGQVASSVRNHFLNKTTNTSTGLTAEITDVLGVQNKREHDCDLKEIPRLDQLERSRTATATSADSREHSLFNEQRVNVDQNRDGKLQLGWWKFVRRATSWLRIGGQADVARKASLDPTLLLEVDAGVLRNALDLLDSMEDHIRSSGEPLVDVASFTRTIVSLITSIDTEYMRAAGRDRVLDWHRQYLEMLRDHFGKVFETLLDRADPASWKGLRVRIVTNFLNCARSSIPSVPQIRGAKLWQNANFSYATALEGLESDMELAMEMRSDLFTSDYDELEGDIDSPARARRERFIKWSKKVAAKGAMLGVNYLQGWFAWQGVKRVALERERKFPKFPLF